MIKKLIIKLTKNMKYISFQDIINIDDDAIEVIGVISSVVKWITKTKIQQHGNKKISSVLLNFNILKTSPSQKFLFAKFVKAGHPREFISTKDFKPIILERFCPWNVKISWICRTVTISVCEFLSFKIY